MSLIVLALLLLVLIAGVLIAAARGRGRAESGGESSGGGVVGIAVALVLVVVVLGLGGAMFLSRAAVLAPIGSMYPVTPGSVVFSIQSPGHEMSAVLETGCEQALANAIHPSYSVSPAGSQWMGSGVLFGATSEHNFAFQLTPRTDSEQHEGQPSGPPALDLERLLEELDLLVAGVVSPRADADRLEFSFSYLPFDARVPIDVFLDRTDGGRQFVRVPSEFAPDAPDAEPGSRPISEGSGD